VVVARERGGRTLPMVFKSEGEAQAFIAARVGNGSKLVADEAPSWNDLSARLAVDRIDHGQVYSLPGGIYTNGAEGFFSRIRRAEIGHRPSHRRGVSPPVCAGERVARGSPLDGNGSQVRGVVGLAMASKPSVDF